MKKFVRGRLGRGLSLLVMVIMMLPGLLTPFTQRANADDSWGKKVFILPFQVTAPNPPDSMGRDILNELSVDLQSQMSVSVIPLERDSIFLAIAYQQHDMLDKAAKATLLEKIHNEYAKRLKEYKNDEDRALLMASYDVAADPNSEVTNRQAAIAYLAQLLKADSFIYGTVDTYEFSDADGAQAKIHLSATQVKFDSNYNALPAAPINVIGKSVVRPDGGGTREMHNAEAVRNIGERLALLLTGKAQPNGDEIGSGDGVIVTSAPAPKRGGSSMNKIWPILGGLALATIIYSATRGGGKSDTPPPLPGTGEGYAYPYPDGTIRLLFTLTPAQWAAAQTFEVYRANQGTRVRAVGVPDAGPLTKAQVNYNSATGVVTIIDRPAANGLFNYQVKMINTDRSYTMFSIFNGTTWNPTVAKNPLVGPYMPPAATGLQKTNEVGGIVDIAWTYPAGSQAGLINRIQILARTGSVWKEIAPLLPVASSATTARIALSGTTDIQVIPLGVGNYKSATLNPEILTITINPTSLTPASNVQAVLAPLPNWTKVNINVTWTPSPDPLVTGYRIYRNTTNTKAMGDAAMAQTGLHPSHGYYDFGTRTGGILVPNRAAAGVRQPAGSTLVQDNIAVTTSRFVDSDIHDGTKYIYTVEAIRTGTSLVADSIPSNDIWVDVPPANASAVTTTPSPGQVVVGWTAPTTNADGSPIPMVVGNGYNVYRLNAAPANPLGYTRAEMLAVAGKKINTNLIPFGTKTITDTTVVNRTNYFYTVEVIDGATPAQSSFGPYPYNSATPMPAVSQLAVTSPNLTLTAGATNVPITVTVSGSDGLGLANYQVSMSTPGVGLGSVSPALPATATTNASGNASFVYTAPMPIDVTTQKTVTLTATVIGALPALTKPITFTINPLAPVAVQLYADNNSVRALGLTALTARIVDVSGIAIPNQPVTIACTDQTCSYLDPVTSTYKLFTTPFTGVTSNAGELRLNIKAGPNTGTATFTATSGTLNSAIANIDILGIPSAVSINLPAQISAVTTGTVTVTDSNGVPVSGIVVHLSTNRGSITPSVFTNAQGQGNFTLTPGTTNTTATVTALLDGGITASTSVTFVTIENPLLVSGGTKIDAHNVHVIVGQATPFIWQLYGGDGLPLASKSVVVKVTNGTIGTGGGNVQSFATNTTSDGQVTFTYNSPITNGSTVLSFTDAANKKIGSDILLKAVLAAPTGLALVSMSDKEIDLTWQNSVGNYGYDIQRAQENNNPLTPLAWTTIYTTTQNITTYNDTHVPQSGTTYFYRLRALAPAGQVDFNSDFTAALQASTFPKKPLLHVPGINDITNGSVKLTWDGTADNFGIYSSPDNLLWSLVQTAPGNNDIAVLNTSIVSVAPSSKQYFRIIANSGGVPSVPSAPVYVIALPPAPTGLALNVISSSQIDLVWNAVAGASSYSISRKTAAEINYTVIAPSLNSTTLSYSDTALLPGTTYFYKVGDSIGSSAPSYSNPVSAMTELQTPINVMIDVSTPITDSTVNISWTGVNGADGYQIYTSPTGLSTSTWTINTIITHVGLPTATQKGQLTGLLGSSTYFIMVVASSNATGNNSKGSWPVMAKTLPAAPSGLTVTATSDKALQLNVTVDPLVGFYEIERSNTFNFTTVDRAWSAVGTEFPYSDTGLTAAHTYYYHIRSVTGGITSSWSVAKSGTTQPSAPVLLSAVPTDVTVALSWTGNGDSYNVESSPTGTTWTLLSTVPAVAGPAQSAIVAAVASTTTFYRIVATAGGVVSAPSNSLGVTTLPVAPAGLTVIPVSAVTLRLGITVDPTVTLYEVERSKSLATAANGIYSDPDGSMIALSGSQFPYNDTGLTAATVYYYHIRSTKAGVKSAWSNSVSSTTGLVTPIGVTVRVIASTDTTLELNWTGVTGADYYTVSRTGLGNPVTVPHVGAAGATQVYTFTGLTAATNYDFTVIANSTAGSNSAASLPATGNTLPAAPVGMNVTAINASTLKLAVTVDPLVTLYEVERSLSFATKADGSFTTRTGAMLNLIGTQFPYSDTGLTAVTLYYYHIRGSKAGVKSAWSPLVSGTTNLATPTGIAVNTGASTDTTLNITWTGVTGADYYTVTRTGLATPVIVPHVGVANALQSFTFTGLTAASSYDFTIVANNSGGLTSAASLPVTGITLPGALTGLTVTSVDAVTLKLGMTIDPTVSLYEIERSKSLTTNADGTFASQDGLTLNLTGGQFPYTNTGLSAATIYYYHVRGSKAGVKTAWSTIATGITLPAAPVLASATPSDISVTLTWTGLGDFYNVESSPNGTTWTPIATTPAGAGPNQTATVASVPDTTTFYRIIASANSVLSAPSNVLAAKTLPAAPAGLTVTSLNASSIKLGVTVDATVTLYEVERSLSIDTISNGSFTTPVGTKLNLIGSQFPYSDTGLTAATLYYYHIRGTKAGVKSAWSPLVSGITGLTTPTGVTVKTIASTDTNLDLNWTGVTGADYYTVTRSNPAITVTVPHVGAPGATQVFSFTGLTAATSYDFTVVANSNDGAVSAASLPVTGKTMPAAPAGLTVTPINASTIKLGVTVDATLTLYEVERSKSPATKADGTFTSIDGTLLSLIGSQFPYSDTGLTAATLYYYHIRGTKAGVKSAWSPLVSATTDLTTPTGVTVNTIASTDTTLDLSWTGVTGADYYTVTRTGLATLVTVPHVGAPGATQVFTFTGLAAATSYDFTVAANSISGAVSTASTPVTGMTLPIAPAGLTVTPTNATTLRIGVTPDATVTLYEVERSTSLATNPNGTFASPVGTMTNLLGSQFPYFDTGLTAATLYYYHIRGTKAGVKSAWSPLVTGATLPTAPVLTSVVPTDVTVTLSWTGVGEFYTVERSTDGAAWTKLPQIVSAIAGPTQTTIDSPVSPSTAYLYRVTASANGVISAPSNVLGTTTKPPTPTGLTITTGIDDKSLIVNITAVPGATSYDLVRSLVVDTNPDGSFTTPDGASILLAPGDLPYTNIGLTGGTDYFYTVRSYVGAAVSGWCLVKSGQTRPSTPKNLAVTAAAITATTIQLTWTGVLGAANYTLTNGNTPMTVPHVGAATDIQTYKVTGLASSTSFDFTVAAKSLMGVSSAASAPVTGKTLAASTIPVVARVTVTAQALLGAERIYYSQGPADQISQSVRTYTDLTITGLDGLDAGAKAASGAVVTFSIGSGPGEIEIVSSNQTKIGNVITGTLNNSGQMIVRFHGRTTNSAVPYTPVINELGLPVFAAESLGVTLPVPLQTQATPVALVGPPSNAVLTPVNPSSSNVFEDPTGGITTMNSDENVNVTATVYDEIGQRVLIGFPMHFKDSSSHISPFTNPDDTIGDGLVRREYVETDANGQAVAVFASNYSGLYTIHAWAVTTDHTSQLTGFTATGTALVRNRTYLSFNKPDGTPISPSQMILDYGTPKTLLSDGTDSALITITGRDDKGKLVLQGVAFRVKTSIGKIQLLQGYEFSAGVSGPFPSPPYLAFNNNGIAQFYMRSDKLNPTVGLAYLTFDNLRVTGQYLALPIETIKYTGQDITDATKFPFTANASAYSILRAPEPSGVDAVTNTILTVNLEDILHHALPAGYEGRLLVDGVPETGDPYIWSGATRMWERDGNSYGWSTNSPFVYYGYIQGTYNLAIEIKDLAGSTTRTTNVIPVRVVRGHTAVITPSTSTNVPVAGTYPITGIVYDDTGARLIDNAKVDFYVVVKAGTYDAAKLYLGSDLTKTIGNQRGNVSISFTPDLTNYASVQVTAFVDRNGNSMIDAGESLGSSGNFSMIIAPLNLRYDDTNKPLSDVRVPLTWDVVAGANRYDIYREGVKIGSSNAPATTFVDNTVPLQATKYNYAVQAINTNVTYGATSALSGGVDIYTAPTKVTIGSIDTITDTTASIHLTTEATDLTATKYRVYDNLSTMVKEVPIVLGQLQIDVTGLSPGVMHNLTVRVVDTTLTPQQESLDSNSKPCLTFPSKVALATTAADTNNTTDVTLHWKRSPVTETSVTGYRIYGGPAPISVPGGSAIQDYKVTGLAAGTAYTFNIKAVSAGGESLVNSDDIKTTTKPGAVTQIGSTVSATVITFNWVALVGNPAVTGYNVYNNGTKIGTVAAGVTLPVTGTYTAGTTYNLTVRAVAGALESADSNIILVSF